MEKNVPIIIHVDEMVANGGPSAYIGIVELSVAFEKELLDSLLLYVPFISSLIFSCVLQLKLHNQIYI